MTKLARPDSSTSVLYLVPALAVALVRLCLVQPRTPVRGERWRPPAALYLRWGVVGAALLATTAAANHRLASDGLLSTSDVVPDARFLCAPPDLHLARSSRAHTSSGSPPPHPPASHTLAPAAHRLELLWWLLNGSLGFVAYTREANVQRRQHEDLKYQLPDIEMTPEAEEREPIA